MMMTGGFCVIVIACLLVITTDSIPTGSLSRQERGFRNAGLSTARGFGKRTLEDFKDIGLDSKSIPLDWFADQLSRNPTLAKLLAKIVDLDGNGFVSQDELYKALL
ncbi:allatotropin-like [Limulus polyphemus]|uniref:Allatotropin-like n=1 Tax=Limulus polyphemus TaxID=6850 RepID=A0ABM1TC70_LIMPO|nr:allatotropin-like [Limulus polyphemus]